MSRKILLSRNTNLDFILLYVCYECLAVEGVVGVPVHVQHKPDMNRDTKLTLFLGSTFSSVIQYLHCKEDPIYNLYK
jgi:hypothetical protein